MRRRNTKNRRIEIPEEKIQGFRWMRAYIVLGFLFLLLSLVVVRAIQIQVTDRGQYLAAAQANVTGGMVFQTRRADITDRNGEMMATSLKAWALVANPTKVPDPGAAAKILAPILKMKVSHLTKLLSKKRRFTFIAHQLAPTMHRRISQLLKEKPTSKILRGLRFDRDYQRYYPKRSVAGQILGWTSSDDRGYTGLELGLDKRFREQIQGARTRVAAQKTGLRRKEGASNLALFENVIPLLQGGPIRVETTIDSGLQEHVETVLIDSLNKHGAKRATAIVYDVKTGAILSFAHVPTIDPNNWPKTSAKDRLPWGIIDTYEPGSVMKVFTIAAALESKAVRANTVVDTYYGRMRIADAVIHDLKKLKQASVRDVLRYSSNIGAVQIARLMGQRELKDILRRGGFGRKTGLPLPFEAAGIANLRPKRWDPVTFANIAFGQGIAVTPIQFMRAFASLGNEGVMLEPHLVHRVYNQFNEIVYEAKPTYEDRLVSARTARAMLDLLESVVSKGATGHLAKVQNCRVGGKTGTGQQIVRDPVTGKRGYSDKHEIASFAGFVPIQNPAVAIYVLIDRPSDESGGGAAAAPAFAKIADATLDYLSLRPCGSSQTRMVTYNDTLPTKQTKKSKAQKLSKEVASPIPGMIVVPNLTGEVLPRALEILGENGLNASIKGTGIVADQRPIAGSVVSAGTPIQLRCALNMRGSHAVE